LPPTSGIPVNTSKTWATSLTLAAVTVAANDARGLDNNTVAADTASYVGVNFRDLQKHPANSPQRPE
jgi:hypothetical protein